jgi:hypothetical protein
MGLKIKQNKKRMGKCEYGRMKKKTFSFCRILKNYGQKWTKF